MLSCERTRQVADELAARGVHAAFVDALGQDAH
jgi:hypothetical protein